MALLERDVGNEVGLVVLLGEFGGDLGSELGLVVFQVGEGPLQDVQLFLQGQVVISTSSLVLFVALLSRQPLLFDLVGTSVVFVDQVLQNPDLVLSVLLVPS